MNRNIIVNYSKYTFLLILVFFANISTFAQNDAHYWTHQYGAKGLLMNGSVIAAPDDAAAIFYNPGAIGNGEDFGLSLSFYSPSYSLLNIDGYLGKNTDLEKNRFEFLPGFGALSIKFKNSRWRAALASFTRLRTDISYRSREVGEVTNEEGFIFVGNLDFSRRVRQRWYGTGIAYKVSNNLSIGLTQFLTTHSESASLNLQKQISTVLNPLEQTLTWRSKTKYNLRYDVGLITKFGLTSSMDKVNLGLVVTTPTYLFLFKKATYEYDDLRFTAGSNPTVISDLRRSQLSNPQTPLSVALGLDFPSGNSKVSFSTEYFFPVAQQTILGGFNDAFEDLPGSSLFIPFYVKSGKKSVMNFAVGIQREVSENTLLIAGFRTDFNQRVLDESLESIDFLSSSPDIYHVSLGGFFTVWKTKFSLGFDYGYGSKKSDVGIIDLENVSPDDFFEFGNNGKVSSQYHSFTFIFTYDFIIKKWNEKDRWLSK